MIEYVAAVLLGMIFILFARRLAQDDTVLNLIASLLLVCLILYIAPELRSVPVGAYFLAWLFSFVGLKFCMPAVEGRPFVWAWRRHGIMVAIAVTG